MLHSAPAPGDGDDYDYDCDPTVHLPEHDCETHLIAKATADRQVRALALRGFDVFINLCDGARDEDSAGIEVVRALERRGAAYTGADPGFYEPSREAMKRACRRRGVATPRSAFGTELEAVVRAAGSLRFPLIVKHPSSYASVGLTRDSRVHDREALRVQVARTLALFGAALVEEFIEGREFTVLVAEDPRDPRTPIAFVPVEFAFPAGECFKHHDLKWLDYRSMTWSAVQDPALALRLQDMSREQFVGLGGCGYGRCDIRMAADGELYMLEINPNCGIFYPPGEPGSADVILARDPAGHRGFLDLIIASALKRQRARRVRRGAPLARVASA